MLRRSALFCVLALAACTPSKTTTSSGGGGGGGGDDAVELSVADVELLEVQRMSARALEPALSSSAPQPVRARAARALARVERLDAAPLLMRAAKDEDVPTRLAAAFGLGQLDLALVAGNELHDETRAGVEDYLALWLTRERAPAVRVAIVRALGRVSTGKGLDVLLELAAGDLAERAEAFYALGVAGARRDASLCSDDRLLKAVGGALLSSDQTVRRGAAYASFRQKLPLGEGTFSQISRVPDAGARIHLTRALKEAQQTPKHAVTLLKDGDWRVRVEAVRALEALMTGGGQPAVKELATAGLKSAQRVAKDPRRYGPEAHVVGAVCSALSNPQAPLEADEVRPRVEEIMRALAPGGESVKSTACRCAVALDAASGRPEAVRSCAPSSWTPAHVRRLEVEVASRTRQSNRERAARLRKALMDPAPLVRTAAAWALVEDGSRHAAEVAADHLEAEDDPGVAGALLVLFQGGNHEKILDDGTIGRVVDRFITSAKSLEDAEPLLQAAQILRTRASGAARDAGQRLYEHQEIRLRELLRATPHGERAPGPRARATPPPLVGKLPMAAVLKTERGDIHIRFERDDAPIAVANFSSLARDGFFDGVRFHRVIGNFVAQGGDPRGDGSGGPGWNIPCENSDARYTRGAIGMALAGKDTGGSQFFLTHSEQPHLDGRYTLFARVTSGLDVMDSLQPEDRILGVDFLGAMPRTEASR
jgi:cyclophilin family peptidyl-prolyl cis-trans isomerase/HEAT repeat protein